MNSEISKTTSEEVVREIGIEFSKIIQIVDRDVIKESQEITDNIVSFYKISYIEQAKKEERKSNSGVKPTSEFVIRETKEEVPNCQELLEDLYIEINAYLCNKEGIFSIPATITETASNILNSVSGNSYIISKRDWMRILREEYIEDDKKLVSILGECLILIAKGEVEEIVSPDEKRFIQRVRLNDIV